MTEWKSPRPIPSCVGMHICELLSMITAAEITAENIPDLMEAQERKPCFLRYPENDFTPAPLEEFHFKALVGFRRWKD